MFYIPKLPLTSIGLLSDEGVHMELLASFVLKEILRELEKDMEPIFFLETDESLNMWPNVIWIVSQVL